MNACKHSFILLLLLLGCRVVNAKDDLAYKKGHADTVIIKFGFIDNKISQEWRDALSPRMSKQKLDSVSALQITVAPEERSWINLIQSKASRWNLFRDSLEMAFTDCHAPDTVHVLLGIGDGNDAFTYRYNTVCFDLSALQRIYGSAGLTENNERIDRLYAHEFTHLIHKEWARKNKSQLRSFKDSILWECIYEGMGMYRSLSKKWLPQEGVLPGLTKNTLTGLYPVFVDMLIRVETAGNLSADEKTRITANLSKGPIEKKWGAFTVAIWLALEADGNDRNLNYWTGKGPDSIILLAKKYLDGENKTRFEEVFKNKPVN